MVQFKGKVALVTGGCSGIGEATALAFAAQGASVAIVDIDREAGKGLVERIKDQGGEAAFFATDVARERDVEAMVKGVLHRWQCLDILVNNAGVYYKGDVTNTSLEEWNRVLAVNLTGAFLCTKHALPAMIGGTGGAVVNVASEAGLVGIKGQVAYNVSKGGMIALARSCAVDLARRGVRVNCICPGTTDTPLVRRSVNNQADPAAERRSLESIRPADRLGTPDEIAAAILYLAGPQAGYTIGAVLSIDGGYTAQ